MKEHPDEEENKNQTLYPTNEELNVIFFISYFNYFYIFAGNGKRERDHKI